MASHNVERLRQDRDRFIGFAFASADLLLELGDDHNISWAGGAANSLLGIDPDRAVGLPVADFLSSLDALTLGTALKELLPGERRRDIELTLQQRSGRDRCVSVCLYRALDQAGAGFHLSISARPDAPRADAPSPRRNRTTGLIEAVEFAETTQGALASARAAGVPARLTLVQMCGEAELTRLLGPGRSQALLAEIGTELKRHAVTADGAADLGDGRFSVTQISGAPESAIADALAKLGGNYDLDPAALEVRETSINFGAASLSEDDVESILTHVLEKFRAGGTEAIAAGSAEIYLRRMAAETLSRIVTMRDIIHERRLNLHFQPIVDLAERKPHHYEVLLRFVDGKSPFEDIQFAEQINTIHEVDLAVAQGAVARLQQAGGDNPALSLAVNMSARSLLNDNFLAMFEQLADKVGPIRRQLIVEITESAKLEDLQRAARAVERLTSRGHPVCLDDFGAGAASLPYLQQLMVGYVKIDGAYVRGIHERRRERAIVQGVLKTCEKLDVMTVAEMVEEEEQHKVLAELGVTYGQGWLYGRPAPEIPLPSAPAAVRVPRKLDPAAIGRLLVKKN